MEDDTIFRRAWAEKFMNDKSDHPEDLPVYSSERQLTAEARSFVAEYADGRRSEGFAWMHYAGFQWTDEGAEERIVILFGPRAVEIIGKNLGVLIDDIREGKLNRIREMPAARRKQLEQSNPDNLPIIRAIRVYPDFAAILQEIKGEEKDEPRHARRA